MQYLEWLTDNLLAICSKVVKCAAYEGAEDKTVSWINALAPGELMKRQ